MPKMTLHQTLSWSLLTPATLAVGVLIVAVSLVVGKLIRDAVSAAAHRPLRLKSHSDVPGWRMAVSLFAGPVALWVLSQAVAYTAMWLDRLLLLPAALALSLMVIPSAFRATRFCGITGGRWVRNWWLNRRRPGCEEVEVPF